LRWIVPQIEPERVQCLVDALRVRPLTARVLANRGFGDPKAAMTFLRPSLADLHDPFLMAGMRQAVDRLKLAIEGKEKILIYGDYDVDGTTSIVLLKKAIEVAGGEASFHVPHRLKDGYGMRTDVIEQAAQSGVRLIVSVDTGIRAEEVVCVARQLGVDVIITDHHLPDTELPPALAVVNPNQLGCRYPEKNLCGAGVAFKLVQGLLTALRWPPARVDSLLASFLKIVAIATVADVVPLTGENRVIVKHGLHGLDKVRNAGLRALLDVAGLPAGSRPTAEEVAFRVAPRINAAGRMAHADNVIRMFLTDSVDNARSIASELHELNAERQQTEQDMVKEILAACEGAPVTERDAALVFCGSGWHRGVVGIVASRLVERFCRPVFVLSEEDGSVQGSGRSIRPFHLLEALEAMPDLFTRFGGHRQAAGLTLAASRVDEFRRRFNEYAFSRLTPDDFIPQLAVDAEVTMRDLDDRSAMELLSLAPFGFGNPCPVVSIRDAEVAAPPVPIGEKHLKIHFRQNGRLITAKAWNYGPRAEEFSPGKRVDVAFSVQEDSFAASRGWSGWGVELKDFHPAEVTSKPFVAGL